MPAAGFLYGRTGYTYLRGAAFLLLSDVGHVVTGSVVSDQGGGGTATWTPSGVSIPCRVDATGGGESVAAAMISERTTHLITLPADAGVDEADRFAIVGRGTFAITAAPQRTGEFLRVLEAVEL